MMSEKKNLELTAKYSVIESFKWTFLSTLSIQNSLEINLTLEKFWHKQVTSLLPTNARI